MNNEQAEELVKTSKLILEELRKLNSYANREYESEKNPITRRPLNQGKPWTEEEEEKLLSEFESELSISVIAELHERSCGSIKSRLVRLGILEKK